jgi:hypothetical protein
MMVLGLTLTQKIILVVLFYGVGYMAVRRGLTLGGAPSGDTGFRPGSLEHLIAKFLPRTIVRGSWVFVGLFFAAIPTLTLIGVLAWQPSDTTNSQRDASYVGALSQIMAPLTRQSYTTGDLNVAISKLGSLAPPSEFVTDQTRLVAALRTQVALDPLIGRANSRHDTAAVNRLEGQVQSTAETITTTMQEIDDTYNRCQSSRFRRC